MAILLDKERSVISASPEAYLSPALDINRPLEEINRDIIKKALADNQGNQSATAKQLGISRMTLWRYLKRD